jgi:hypothetical protein
MTRRLQLIIGDDLDWRESRTHTDADETLVLALGPDVRHLKLRELDLTAEHADVLRAALKPYLDAGHDPDEQPELPPAPSRSALLPHPGQGKRREVPGTRAFLTGLREFAAAGGDPVPSTTGKSGKTNYRPRPDQYAAYAEQLRQRAAAGDGKAAGLLGVARQMGLGLQDAGSVAAGNGLAPVPASQ